MIFLFIVIDFLIGLSVWGIANELDDILYDDEYLFTFAWYLFCWPIVFIVKIPDLYRLIANIFIDKRK